MAPSDPGTHTRVGSVHGPEWCCQECSTNAKQYVEWPCAAKALETFGLMGAVNRRAAP